MLPEVHLTLHSRISGSRWVITPSWLSGSCRSFLYNSSAYSCHLLISSVSVRSILFQSFIVPIFAWNVPLISLIFLKRSLVFPILLFSSISEGGKKSLRKAFLSLLAILWNSAFKWVYFSFSPLLLGRKAKTNLDSILNSRDITLTTKVHLVKVMAFPVVMYGCESWTIKKAECQRIDAFELWFWRRLLRACWTARRSNQSILKELSPEFLWKDWCWSWNSNS